MPHRLNALSLDTSKPGFYDLPAFRVAEQSDPRLLEAYAAFVRQLTLNDGYLAYARERVKLSAKFLVDNLRKDGRTGACIDMSQTLSRFLERQGVWNYMVSGCVRMTFAPRTMLSTKHFWNITVSGQDAAAAHMWLYAPPFKVVDLTLRLQPYSHGEQKYLPHSILAETPPKAEPEFDDFADPDVVVQMARSLKRPPVLADVKQISKGILARVAALGAWNVHEPDVSIKYVGCAVSAPDGPLETAANLVLNKKTPIQLWHDFYRLHHPPAVYKPKAV